MFDSFHRPGMASCLLRTCLGVHSQCTFDSSSYLNLSLITPHLLTSSNGGVFGSLYGTPIINLPQAAVLGIPRFFLAIFIF